MMTSKSMPNESEILPEADEIAALLPWYVSGKISAADKARVEAYAESHPEVRGHIALARDEADVIFADNQSIPPPRAALERLHASVARSPRARLHSVQASVVDRLGTWLGGFAPRQLAYAGLAAAVLIAVQSLSLGSLLKNQSNPANFTVANKPEARTSGTFALVAFQPAAPASTLSAFLADNNFVIVDGPKAGGMYRVRVNGKVLTGPETEAALTKLKSRADLIAFASSAPAVP